MKIFQKWPFRLGMDTMNSWLCHLDSHAPMEFMDLMNRVFRNYLDSFFIVLIDDILVYSKNEVDHMGHLRIVLKILKEHQLFAKYRKCEFWLRLVSFLGHIISIEKVEVDPRKRNAVRNWPRPLTLTDIRSFLGITGFSSIASPLTTLIQKSKKFEWWKACENSFQLFKDKLTYALV